MRSYTQTCALSNVRKSILGITLSVATPQMHDVKPPIVVGPGESIQAAIDAPTTQTRPAHPGEAGDVPRRWSS